MRRMGGLKKYMPTTYWTFLLAAAANAGIWPLAGFWSKDEIIVGAYLDDAYIIMLIGFIAAFFTALYMFRVVFWTFHGEERFDPAEVHPHESPRIMTWPLIALAVPTVALGALIGWPPEAGWIHDFLEPNFHLEESGEAVASTALLLQEGAAEEHHVSNTTLVIFGVISTIVALAGVGVAYLAYIAKSPVFSPAVWSDKMRPLYSFFFRKYYADELYESYIVHPLYVLSDKVLWQIVDVRIIDGIVNGVASTVTFSSGQLRRVQTGFVANYALAIAIGAVVFIGLAFLFQSSLLS